MFQVKKPPANANVPRTIRFTDKLFEELHEVAAKNGVSFNTLVLECCAYALERLPKDEGE